MASAAAIESAGQKFESAEPRLCTLCLSVLSFCQNLSWSDCAASFFLQQCLYRPPIESRCERSMFAQVYKASLRAPVV